jgi:hypothetical protein
MSKINIPIPELQIRFAELLRTSRNLYLQEALAATIAKLDIKTIDHQLSSLE